MLATLAACGGSSTPSAAHQTYDYTSSSGPPRDTWSPGQAVPVTWAAQLGRVSTDPRPARVVLALKLYGPFASVDAVKKAVSSGTAPLAVTGPAIATDNWHTGSFSAALSLPGTLAPGTYDLAQSATTTTSAGSVTARGDSIITIVAG
jgi:hypothetical protein